MNGLKIALVGDFPPPHGGVAIHVQQLHGFLREQGVEVRGLDVGAGTSPCGPGVERVGTAAALATRLLELARAGFILHLHSSGNNPKSWALIAFVGLFPAKGRVLTLHSGLAPDFLARAGTRWPLARTALARYQRVIAVSAAIRDSLVRHGVSGSKLLVQPAFLASQVRPGMSPVGFAEVRKRRGPLLVMAHHPSPIYGRLLAFKAVRLLLPRLPDLGLAVFGPGTGSANFLQDARAEGIEGLLEDFGELAHPQALALLAGSDVFLRPTSADGDALSVREALALGVSCVASDVAARPAGTRLFSGGDPKALAEAICEAALSPSLTAAGPDVGPILLSLYRECAAGSSKGEPVASVLRFQEET